MNRMPSQIALEYTFSRLQSEGYAKAETPKFRNRIYTNLLLESCLGIRFASHLGISLFAAYHESTFRRQTRRDIVVRLKAFELVLDLG